MADIGVHAHEHGAPQPLDIDVVLLIRQVEQDSIEATIDYSDIKRNAEALAMRRISLIETYARELAMTFCRHPQVLEASVVIAKPNALEGCLAGTEVTLRNAG